MSSNRALIRVGLQQHRRQMLLWSPARRANPKVGFYEDLFVKPL